MDKDTKKHLNDEIFCALLSAFSEHFSPRHARLFLSSWQLVLPTAMICSSPYGRKAGCGGRGTRVWLPPYGLYDGRRMRVGQPPYLHPRAAIALIF